MAFILLITFVVIIFGAFLYALIKLPPEKDENKNAPNSGGGLDGF